MAKGNIINKLFASGPLFLLYFYPGIPYPYQESVHFSFHFRWIKLINHITPSGSPDDLVTNTHTVCIYIYM